jgi:acetylglutamate kinase
LEKVIVVKIGGATLGSHDTAIKDIVDLQKKGRQLIIVHGGGKVITEWLKKQGAGTSFVRGERVTDQATLEVATAVLSGLVNKDIVATINTLGGKAVGISGVDGGIIRGSIAEKEKGFVGAVSSVDTALLETLLGTGYIPVIATIGLNSDKKPADEPLTLNYNADVVAGEIAAALKAEMLVFLTDVEGVSDGSGKILGTLLPGEAEDLIGSGVASGGMIPKIQACLKALSGGSKTCIIDGRKSHALSKKIEGKNGGTTIGE